MRYYTLYNKRLDRLLHHPKIGLWYTPDINEACSMLEACRSYVQTLGVDSYDEDFVIVDAKTGEEIKLE